jgi:transcriptional regulator of arginine metabolism
MSSRPERHRVLRELLTAERLATLTAVRGRLADLGVVAHAATVGRDLEELGARKERDADGNLAYRIPTVLAMPAAPARVLDDALATFVSSVAVAGNLLVLRTPPACASPVASALDRASEGRILGTVAGDDTVLAVVADGHDPLVVADELRRRIARGPVRVTAASDPNVPPDLTTHRSTP